MISLTDDRKMLGYGLLGAYPNISHFVTTRHGGYSEGAYASFNCSPFSGDELERVEKNQTLLFQSLSQAPRHLIPSVVADVYAGEHAAYRGNT